MSRYGPPISQFNRLNLGREQRSGQSAGMVTTRAGTKRELAGSSGASGGSTSERRTPVASSSRAPAQAPRPSRHAKRSRISRGSRPHPDDDDDGEDDPDKDDDGDDPGSDDGSDEESDDEADDVYQIFSTFTVSHHSPKEFARRVEPPPLSAQRQV